MAVAVHSAGYYLPDTYHVSWGIFPMERDHGGMERAARLSDGVCHPQLLPGSAAYLPEEEMALFPFRLSHLSDIHLLSM